MTATKKTTFLRDLQSYGPCRDAFAFAEQFHSFQEAWDKCQRPDWMFWIIGGTAAASDHKTIVRIACDIARTALPYTVDVRVARCIEVTELWIAGLATLDDVRAAADAAYAAYAARAAADAAYAAAYAARAARAAAYAAYAADAARAAYAAYAARAAAYAARAAADAAADAARAAHCDIIRKHFPIAPKLSRQP